ncbi:MAG: hypothetical protein RSB93_06950, partial [Rikenellaceae bacterium]
MITFLNKKAYDQYRLSKEDVALAKEEKTEVADKKDKKGDTKEENKDIVVERIGLVDRTIRLTAVSSDIPSAAITDDGNFLYYTKRDVLFGR